ncbi:MAG: hypothetical protein HYS24_04530 [Ignavibacteriales bacterium]|nr:hypothetical protein [Ignavibacteriales bacterium]
MKLRILIYFAFSMLTFNQLVAQNINGRITSSLYAFERAQSIDNSDMFLRAYETLTLNVNEGNYSLKSRLNFETNFSNALDNDPRLRVYNLFFEARKVFNVATVKLGRQPIFNQVAGGLFDGANVKLNYSDFAVEGYFGGAVPAYQELKFTDDLKNNNIFGGEVSYSGLSNTKLSLSYVDKSFKPISYNAQRLDANLNPITILIENNSTQYSYGSFGASYFGVVDADARINFDFNFMKVSRVELNGRYAATEKLGIDLYYNYRAPQIRYNSIFAVFDFGNTNEIEAGLDYKINNDFSVFGKFGDVEYKDENSQRFTIGVNSIYGGLSYRQTLGYAGELSSITASTGKSFMNGLLTPSIGLAYTNYKLSADEEANDIISALTGLNIRPWRTLSFDLQGQFSDNKIYKNDLRLFFKINYWFNTNLDLL